MLKRNVKIAADFGIARHSLEYVLGELGRIGIMNPYPLYALNFGKFVDKLRQSPPVIKVQSIIGRVLGNENEFLYALGGKQAGFFDEFFHRHGAVRTANERDGAV